MHLFTTILIVEQCVRATLIRLSKINVLAVFFFFCKQTESPLSHTSKSLKNFVKFKIYSFAHKLTSNPSTVPAVLRNVLTPTTTVHSYNTRNSAQLNFYRPKVRTNILGKFTFKYSDSVMWKLSTWH